MTIKHYSHEVDTEGDGDTRNITEMLSEKVAESSITNGLVVVFCPSSTSAVTTLEYEKGCVEDLKAYFERVTPSNMEYRHNLRWGDGNGYSHLRATLLGPSVSIPVQDGRLMLGTWQQVVLVDFDNRPRTRKLVVQIIGE